MKSLSILVIVFSILGNLNSQIQVGSNNCVGIGAITTPSATLDVLGTTRISHSSEADINYCIGSNTWEAGSNNSGISVANQYYIFENTGYRMRFHRSGNIMLYTLPNDPFPWIFEKNGSDPCLYATSNYGILGRADKPLYQIYSNSIRCNGVWLSSDERLKSNVKNISGSLKKIKSVKVVSYDLTLSNQDSILLNSKPKYFKDYKDSLIKDIDKTQLIKRNKEIAEENKNRIGYLAQDLKAIFPELVHINSQTGLYSVDYIGMIPVLTNAINEQQTLIDRQDSIIQSYKNNFESIKTELDEIRKQIKKQKQ
jgi:hypothetical protein